MDQTVALRDDEILLKVLFRGDSLLYREPAAETEGLQIECATLLNLLREEHTAEVSVVGERVERLL